MDYRDVDNSLCLGEAKFKKQDLENTIKQEHPRQVFFYNAISDRKKPYFSRFLEIYQYKCSYCGVALEIAGFDSFEVDHYVCEGSAMNRQERIKVNRAENLVLACSSCNKYKLDLILNGKYCAMLDPDGPEITQIFYRSDDYSIKVSDEYKWDACVVGYHAKLKLGYAIRRLDYLLMRMRALQNILNEKSSKDLLNSAILRLQDKRNCTYWFSDANAWQ